MKRGIRFLLYIAVICLLSAAAAGCKSADRSGPDNDFLYRTRDPNAGPTATPFARNYKGTDVDHADTTHFFKWKKIVDEIEGAGSDGRLPYDGARGLFTALSRLRITDEADCFTSAFDGILPKYNAEDPKSIGSYFWEDLEIRLLRTPVRVLALVQGESTVYLPIDTETFSSLMSRLSDPANTEAVTGYVMNELYSIDVTYDESGASVTFAQKGPDGSAASVVLAF